jgi:hypothetical protein
MNRTVFLSKTKPYHAHRCFCSMKLLIYLFATVLVVGWAVILDEVIRNIISIIQRHRETRSRKSAESNDKYYWPSGSNQGASA